MSLRDTIYKVDLYSITQDIIIYENKSKFYDIAHTFDDCAGFDEYFTTKKLLTILVKQIHSPYYFKELITGKKIPRINIRINNFSGKVCDYYGVGSPIFIKDKSFEFSKEHPDIEIANSNDVEQYLKEHPNKKKYLEELNQMFRLANEYYNNAYNKLINEKEKTKIMIKNYVKNNKKNNK